MLKKLPHFLFSQNRKIFVSIGLTLFLLIALSITYQSTFKSQELRKKAAFEIGKLPTQYKQPILIIDLNIDKSNSAINVLSIQKGLGFVPDYKNTEALDFIKVNIENSQKPKEFFIPIPVKEVYAPPLKQSDHLNFPPRLMDKFNLIVILPYSDNDKITITKTFYPTKNNSITQNKKITVNLASLTSKKGVIEQENVKKEVEISELPKRYFGLSNSQYSVETIYDGDPSITNPMETLDIVFVSSGFDQSNFDLFKSFTEKQSDSLFGFVNFSGKSPYKDHKKVLKIRRLISTDKYHTVNNGYTSVDTNTVIKVLAALGIPYDQFSVVLNADGRSYATLGGQYNILFRTWYGTEERNLLFAHEFSHSFAALLDEYVEYWGNTSDLYDYGRNCKDDPSQNWPNNTTGGSYLGCDYYWNLYKPELDSLMNSLNNNLEFNNPSKDLIEQAFNAYTQNGVSLIINPSIINNYNHLNYPITYPIRQSILLRNIGLSNVEYLWKFNPDVSWIKNVSATQTIPGDFSFDIDYPQLTAKGKYQTSLIIETKTNPSIKKEVPINVVVGNDNDQTSINIDLKNNTVINSGDAITIPMTYSSTAPGIKRVNYYMFDPWSNPANDSHKYLFQARTLSPYQGTFLSNNGYPFKGTYILMAEAYPYFGVPVKSNQIEIEIKATPGTICSSQYTPYQCTNSKIARTCFKGAQDCENLNLPYCCPTNITPTISISPSITITPTTTPSQTPTPTISNSVPYFTTYTLPGGYMSQPYSTAINATDNDPFETLSLTFKKLPTWLKQGPCVKTTSKEFKVKISCSFSGTPTKTGIYSFYGIVSDKTGQYSMKDFQIVVLKRRPDF